MTKIVAEIIAFGDELVSGQRLDTNTKWLSERLSETGIEASFHSCVGDCLENGINVLEHAVKRSDIVVTTGGIGPTKDDLTRQIIADVAEVELEYHADVELHIKQLYRRFGRKMPANNKLQAYFPAGSTIIENEEGTAPGIHAETRGTHILCLPGVPYEMKTMWESYVQNVVLGLTGGDNVPQVIRHHVIHCFGSGESQTEEMLKDLTERNRNPRVGITASQATISLRVTSFGESNSDCDQQIVETTKIINERIGNFVFGENGVRLEDVVIDELIKNSKTLSLVDFGFGGAAGLLLHNADKNKSVIGASTAKSIMAENSLELAACRIVSETNCDIGVAVSGVEDTSANNGQFYKMAIQDGNRSSVKKLRYAGHSGLRESRTAKQVLNEIRIFLTSQSE